MVKEFGIVLRPFNWMWIPAAKVEEYGEGFKAYWVQWLCISLVIWSIGKREPK